MLFEWYKLYDDRLYNLTTSLIRLLLYLQWFESCDIATERSLSVLNRWTGKYLGLDNKIPHFWYNLIPNKDINISSPFHNGLLFSSTYLEIKLE